MRLGLTSSMAALLAGTGLVLGQASAPYSTGQTQSSQSTYSQPSSPALAKNTPAPISVGDSVTSVAVGSTPPAPVATEGVPSPGFGYNPSFFASGPSCIGCAAGDRSESSYPYYRSWGYGDYLLYSIRNVRIDPFNGAEIVGLITANTATTSSVTTNVTTTTSVQIDSLPATTSTVTNSNTVAGPNLNVNTPVESLVGVTTNFPGGNSNAVGQHSGFRVGGGVWLDKEQYCGIDTSFFQIERRTAEFTQATGTRDVNPPDGVVISVPFPSSLPAPTAPLPSDATIHLATVDGTVTAKIANEMWGAEINARSRLCYFGSMVFDGFVGFRYIDFAETLEDRQVVNVGFAPVSSTDSTSSTNTTTQQTTILVPDPADPTHETQTNQTTTVTTTTTTTTNATTTDSISPNPSQFIIFDNIRIRNRFYGGQVGGFMEWYYGNFFVNALGKVGLGGIQQIADVNSFTITPSGVTAGGLLSSAADQGRHMRTRWGFIPESNIKLGMQITSCFRAYVGWDYIYFNNIARPVNQTQLATTNVNVTIAGTSTTIPVTNPVFRFQDGHMWASGASFGFEFRY